MTTTDDPLNNAGVNADHNASAEPDYFLISFAPSSGTGFYDFQDQIYWFDLVRGTDSVCGPDGYAAILQEQDQVEARLVFAKLDELKRVARREYLRDKKNTYFALVLTAEVRSDLLRRILRFLNESEVSEIPLSDQITPILYEIASRELAERVLYEARDYTNVLKCFGRELPSLTFEALQPALGQTIVEFRFGTEWWPILTQVVSAAERIPARVAQSLRALVSVAEARWAEIGARDMLAITELAGAVGYQPPWLVLRRALVSNTSGEMTELYQQALAMNYDITESSRSREYPAEIRDLGKAALGEVSAWTSEWDWPFPWQIGLGDAALLFGQSLKVAFSYRGPPLVGHLPNGLPFVLEFADRKESMLREILETRNVQIASILASRTAFWVAFLLDPRSTVSRFRPARSGRYESARDVARMTIECYRRWGFPKHSDTEVLPTESSIVWSVCFPDLINFAALPIETGGEGGSIQWATGEREETIVAIASQAGNGDVNASLGLRDPLSLLVNNLLSFRLYSGDTATVAAISRVLAATRRPIEITGLLRIVL
jgi:hypothetical protein